MKQRLRQLLFEIEQLKRSKVQEFLLGIGLTPGQGQARILMSLESSEHVTQRKLADECMLDVTTMSRTLDRLEKQGLIERRRNPGCRRAYLISLTAAGRVTAGEVKAGFRQLEEILFDGFGQEEMDSLAGKLERIKYNLEGKMYEKQ